jgi:hypothetical protein
MVVQQFMHSLCLGSTGIVLQTFVDTPSISCYTIDY